MFNKKGKKSNSNPYPNLRSADAQYFTKLDEKIALAQKQNKKEFCEFLIDKKQLDMNYINVKNDKKVGKLDLIPSSLLSILSARDDEKLFENYKKDTMKIAKQLFDEDMTIEQICAVACEFVRLSTANFDRYESETVQNPQSAICQLLSTNAFGILSFYFGVSNAVEQTEFLAWLINMGLDIKHSLSYAECVIDAYGQPVCHIVEFNGKLGVSLINYIGIAKLYSKKIEKLTGLCEFIDFTEEIENGRKRALKVLAKYVPSKLMIKNRNIENAIVEMAQIARKNMSNVTATELNMLSIFGNKIWKFSSLCELLLYENGAEYEVIPDLFVETQYAFKLKFDNDGKFKIFPNKVIDEEYKLNEPKVYILNKTSKQQSISSDDDLFNERIESIGRENKDVKFDDLEPMPANDVLNSLNVKFMPKENEGLSFENGTFKFNDDEMNEIFDLSSATQVDFNKADEEQRMFEQATGTTVLTQQNALTQRKDFFDLLNEMSEKTKKNKARRLQEEYERLERNHELNTAEKVQENAIKQNKVHIHPKQNDTIKIYEKNTPSEVVSNTEHTTIATQNGYFKSKDNYTKLNANDNISAKKENNVEIDSVNNVDYDLINNNYLPSNDIGKDLDYTITNNDIAENDSNIANFDSNTTKFGNYLDNNDNLTTKYVNNGVENDSDSSQSNKIFETDENYDEINAINSNFENINNAKTDENVDEEITEGNTGNDVDNIAKGSIYDDIMQFSDYNYYDRTEDDDEIIDEQLAETNIENTNQDKNLSKIAETSSTPIEVHTQSNKDEEQPQKQEQEKSIEAPKSIEKNVIEQSPKSKVENKQSSTHTAQAPATKVTNKSVRAPQTFAPPIPKRKPAPPLPKRKK